MIKQTITYDTFDGETLTEDFYFNLSKGEVIRMEMQLEGGLKATLERLIQTRDGKEIMAIIENLILTSYGVKSLDGRRFEKSDEELFKFKNSDAYSELLYKLLTDADKASTFVNGLLPAKLIKEAEDANKEKSEGVASVIEKRKDESSPGMTEAELREALEAMKNLKQAE